MIESSLKSHQVAGHNYNNEHLKKRVTEMYENGNSDVFNEGPRMESIFTIPVCDVSAALSDDWPYAAKHYILQPYGDDKRMLWCGPICGGDEEKSMEFLKAAHFQDEPNADFTFGCVPKYETGREVGKKHWTWFRETDEVFYTTIE